MTFFLLSLSVPKPSMLAVTSLRFGKKEKFFIYIVFPLSPLHLLAMANLVGKVISLK